MLAANWDALILRLQFPPPSPEMAGALVMG